jgi:hypothetical protein
MSAFVETEEAKEARLREEQQRIEEEKAKKFREEQAKASRTSIADSAKTRKSAFFKRAQAQNNSEQAADDQEERSSAYDGIVRPSAIVDEEREIAKLSEPAIGEVLEGQRSSIMDPSLSVAPTASKPVEGFKGSDKTEKRNDKSFRDPSSDN